MGTALQTRNFYLNKCDQTGWLFESNLNFRSSKPIFQWWQSWNLVIKIKVISNIVRSAAAVTDGSTQDTRTHILHQLDYFKFNPAFPTSQNPLWNCGLLALLSSLVTYPNKEE